MRYKEFNPNRVLELSIPLFWKNGFNACSINEIVEKTGVNRFSLYHEFENKEGILYAAMKLYHERYAQKMIALLDQPGEVIDLILNCYNEFFKDKEKHFPGDFIIHISTEMADHDPVVKALLENYLEAIENRLIKLLASDPRWENEASKLSKHILGLFCTSMSFCLIHTEEFRINFIKNGINVLLKPQNYAETA